MKLAKTSVKFIFAKKLPGGKNNLTKLKRNSVKLIENILYLESAICHNINIMFCGDSEIKEYNRKYLGHDYETDIITFRYDDETVESDILISLDSVKRNATKYGTSFENEIFRVIIHGVLHICGYEDYDKAGKIKMRKKENKYLKLKDVLQQNT